MSNMNYFILENQLLNEQTYIFQADCGMNIYITPKPGFFKKCAMFGVKYGSIKNRFKKEGDKDFTEIPDGVAHFLEHKLFESETGDAFAKYAKTGANANAFTSFTNTAYYFTCTDRFEENLKILTELMQTPYFTPENVKKEQGIIGQEINMYLDHPGWRVYFNLLEGMYHTFPVRRDIAGSVDSIAKITADMLYDCYDTFYNASNMVLSICGDVDPFETAEYANSLLTNIRPAKNVEVNYDEEPEHVLKQKVSQKLSVSMPLFNIGFKDNLNGFNSDTFIFKEILGNICLEVMFGRSSEFYNTHYESGLINDNFDLEYSLEAEYSHTLISGESDNPEKVYEEVLKTIEQFGKNGIPERVFKRQLNILKADFIKEFNNVETTARNMIDAHFHSYNIYNNMKMFDVITPEDATKYIRSMRKENCVLSTIMPKE